MNYWDLTPIYPSLKSEAFLNDMEQLKVVVEKMNAFVEATIQDDNNVTSKLEAYIQLSLELNLLARTLGGYCSLLTSANTNDEEAGKYEETIQTILTNTVMANTLMSAWIARQDLDAAIEGSALLEEHRFILKEIKDSVKFQLSEKEEMVIASMKQTGSNAWARFKDQLIGAHTVDYTIDGETQTLPLTVVLNMAYDGRKDVRKAAYEAEVKSYASVENSIAACLNGIKGEVLTTSKMRGYTSPLEMTLIDSRMDQETLDVMLAAIRESLPAFRSYLRAKAEHLGYSNGLPWYEMYAPVVTKDMPYSYEDGCDFILKHFKNFDESLYLMAKRAIDEHWIDVESRPGKVGGAFCADVPSLKQSRVLLNWADSFDAVVTMAHELGHAFHNECAKDESLLNLGSPMQLAETASTFNETMLKKAAIKEMDDEEALAVLEAEVSGCNQVIVDIYSRFLFESMFFEARKNGALSAREINELMVKAQKESYGDGLDPDYLHPYMWTWKPHYYYADSNFYNFPYAFGQLFAKGLYAKYVEEGDSFIPTYKKLLATTGKMSIYDVCMSVGIDVHDINFWRSSLKMCEEDIEQFKALLKK